LEHQKPETIEYMKNIGVDEIACLTDFGLKFDCNGKYHLKDLKKSVV